MMACQVCSSRVMRIIYIHRFQSCMDRRSIGARKTDAVRELWSGIGDNGGDRDVTPRPRARLLPGSLVPLAYDDDDHRRYGEVSIDGALPAGVVYHCAPPAGAGLYDCVSLCGASALINGGPKLAPPSHASISRAQGGLASRF